MKGFLRVLPILPATNLLVFAIFPQPLLSNSIPIFEMCILDFRLTLFYFYLLADPKKQLELAVKAVFDSWDSPRAIKYRSINQITGLKGTAVNIQCMVFGNMGNTSGTGVLFTRNPSTGEKKLYGEFLLNAQVINTNLIFMFLTICPSTSLCNAYDFLVYYYDCYGSLTQTNLNRERM